MPFFPAFQSHAPIGSRYKFGLYQGFLGHVSTTTTEIYARASEKKKQEALSRVNPGIIKEGKTTWQKDKSLLGYLKDLRAKY